MDRTTKEPSGKTPLKMSYFTRHDLRSKGCEGVKQKGRANSTLGSSVSEGKHAAKKSKKDSGVPLRLSVGCGTGGQKETHVSDDCFCTNCIGV